MKPHYRSLAAGLALALTACNGSTSTTTPATPTPALANVAGQYHGKVSDSVFGAGKAFGDFSQTGASVGGRLRMTYASQTIVNSVAMVLSRANALSGTAIATIGAAACTFSVSGTYDAATFVLAGNYTAVSGCSSENGTFSLKEACFYRQSAVPSPQRDAGRRNRKLGPDAAGLHAC